MRWPFAKGEADQLRDAGEVSIEPAAEFHRSPGLEAALSQLHEDRPCSILDLGPALAHNVDFFSRFTCRLCIVDLLGSLSDESERAARLDRAPEEVFDELLPVDLQPFDLILTWTAFDHIDLEAARFLASRLAQLTRARGRLYAIIAMSNTVGDTGLDFAIRDRSTLEYRPGRRPEFRRAPYTPAAFAQLLEGFAIDHSVLLRHGFQEYVGVRLETPLE